jgi:hypothetical protein
MVACMGVGTVAEAAPTDPLTDQLVALWKVVLQTPVDQNPFGGGSPCVQLGGNVVAPFGPAADGAECPAPSGARIFEVGTSGECSTFETCGPDLAAGARSQSPCPLAPPPSVTLDRQPVALTFVQSPVVPVVVPLSANRNVFGVPGGRGQFVAVGWVATVGPLRPGRHVLFSPTTSTCPGFTTTIDVG